MGLLLLCLLIGFVGWVSVFLFGVGNRSASYSRIQDYFVLFVSGFGLTGVCLFLLALSGWFHTSGFMLVAGGFLLVAFLFRKRFKLVFFRPNFFRYLCFCFILGVLVLLYSHVSKPYEAILQGGDASVYAGAAFQLAENGSLIYRDPTILEMTEEERKSLLKDGRLPGGIRILQSNTGLVAFGFLHLLPAWLAFSIRLLGHENFLYVLHLFTGITMISIYQIGKNLGGRLLGISVSMVLLVFYPQYFFSHLPLSEPLSQCLFLSGLWIFIYRFRGNQPPIFEDQLLIGVLWGSAFLARFDTIFLIWISLLFAFSILPFLFKNFLQWRALFVTLILFSVISLYQQALTISYAYLFGLGEVPIVGLLMVRISRFGQWMVHHRIAGTFGIGILTMVVISLLKRYTGESQNSSGIWLRIILFFVCIGSLLVLFGRYFDVTRFINLAASFSSYTSWPLYWILLGGVLFTVCMPVWRERPWPYSFMLVFMLISALCFLIRPLMKVEHPLVMRRFVTFVFPLLFLISFGGLFRFCETIIHRKRVSKLVFALIVCSFIIGFVNYSFSLITNRLFAGVIRQMKVFGEQIKPQTLVVIPSEESGSHMQTAMEFLVKRPTLVLPENLKSKELAVMEKYFERQLNNGRTVILLLTTSLDPVAPLMNRFQLRREFEQPISFSRVPGSDSGTELTRIDDLTIPYQARSLTLRGEFSEKTEIRFDDPDAVFLNFHDPEEMFRWTQEESSISNFVFSNRNQKTIVVLTTGYYPGGISQSLQLSVHVNGSIPTKFTKRVGKDFYFEVEEGRVSTITNIIIRSNTFVTPSDQRRLGISFVKLSFVIPLQEE
jgi:hypothetical protein